MNLFKTTTNSRELEIIFNNSTLLEAVGADSKLSQQFFNLNFNENQIDCPSHLIKLV